MYANVCGFLICNSQKVKTRQICINRQLNCGSSTYEIIINNKNKWTIGTHTSMDDFQDNYCVWKNPDRGDRVNIGIVMRIQWVNEDEALFPCLSRGST